MSVYKPGAPLLLKVSERRTLYVLPCGHVWACIGGGSAPQGATVLGEETETLTYRQRVNPATLEVRREIVGRTLDGNIHAEDAARFHFGAHRLTLEAALSMRAVHA